MLIVFFIILFIIIVLYFTSLGRYGELVGLADDKLFRLKPLLPMGLQIMYALRYGYTSSYDKRLLAVIAETEGYQKAASFLKLHWANKLVMLLGGFLFLIFIGVFTEKDASYIFFCLITIGGIAILPDKGLFSRAEKRKLSIKIDFPDFVNKLVLLINAGMTISRAWEKIASDTSKKSPLYIELKHTLQEIKGGKPEHSAYEEFAKRCRIPEITRFVSVVLQNIKKGNSEIVPVLRVFAMECWEMRKSTARRYGEEASTKMLLPLMLMFLAILLIVGTPAVLALRSV